MPSRAQYSDRTTSLVISESEVKFTVEEKTPPLPIAWYERRVMLLMYANPYRNKARIQNGLRGALRSSLPTTRLRGSVTYIVYRLSMGTEDPESCTASVRGRAILLEMACPSATLLSELK